MISHKRVWMFDILLLPDLGREPYVDAAQKNPFGGWSIDGFFSMVCVPQCFFCLFFFFFKKERN
jgi:hypothetical protein